MSVFDSVVRWASERLSHEQLLQRFFHAPPWLTMPHVSMQGVILVSLIAFVGMLYYLILHVRRPVLLYARTPLNTRLVHCMRLLSHAYWPTPYLTHEFVQAAVGSFVRMDPRIKRDRGFEREVHRMQDGELLALDWLHPTPTPDGKPAPDNTPVVFVMHGLAGHTDEVRQADVKEKTCCD